MKSNHDRSFHWTSSSAQCHAASCQQRAGMSNKSINLLATTQTHPLTCLSVSSRYGYFSWLLQLVWLDVTYAVDAICLGPTYMTAPAHFYTSWRCDISYDCPNNRPTRSH